MSINNTYSQHHNSSKFISDLNTHYKSTYHHNHHNQQKTLKQSQSYSNCYGKNSKKLTQAQPIEQQVYSQTGQSQEHSNYVTSKSNKKQGHQKRSVQKHQQRKVSDNKIVATKTCNKNRPTDEQKQQKSLSIAKAGNSLTKQNYSRLSEQIQRHHLLNKKSYQGSKSKSKSKSKSINNYKNHQLNPNKNSIYGSNTSSSSSSFQKLRNQYHQQQQKENACNGTADGNVTNGSKAKLAINKKDRYANTSTAGTTSISISKHSLSSLSASSISKIDKNTASLNINNNNNIANKPIDIQVLKPSNINHLNCLNSQNLSNEYQKNLQQQYSTTTTTILTKVPVTQQQQQHCDILNSTNRLLRSNHNQNNSKAYNNKIYNKHSNNTNEKLLNSSTSSTLSNNGCCSSSSSFLCKSIGDVPNDDDDNCTDNINKHKNHSVSQNSNKSFAKRDFHISAINSNINSNNNSSNSLKQRRLIKPNKKLQPASSLHPNLHSSWNNYQQPETSRKGSLSFLKCTAAHHQQSTSIASSSSSSSKLLALSGQFGGGRSSLQHGKAVLINNGSYVVGNQQVKRKNKEQKKSVAMFMNLNPKQKVKHVQIKNNNLKATNKQRLGLLKSSPRIMSSEATTSPNNKIIISKNQQKHQQQQQNVSFTNDSSSHSNKKHKYCDSYSSNVIIEGDKDRADEDMDEVGQDNSHFDDNSNNSSVLKQSFSSFSNNRMLKNAAGSIKSTQQTDRLQQQHFMGLDDHNSADVDTSVNYTNNNANDVSDVNNQSDILPNNDHDDDIIGDDINGRNYGYGYDGYDYGDHGCDFNSDADQEHNNYEPNYHDPQEHTPQLSLGDSLLYRMQTVLEKYRNKEISWMEQKELYIATIADLEQRLQNQQGGLKANNINNCSNSKSNHHQGQQHC